MCMCNLIFLFLGKIFIRSTFNTIYFFIFCRKKFHSNA